MDGSIVTADARVGVWYRGEYPGAVKVDETYVTGSPGSSSQVSIETWDTGRPKHLANLSAAACWRGMGVLPQSGAEGPELPPCMHGPAMPSDVQPLDRSDNRRTSSFAVASKRATPFLLAP